MEHPNAEIFRAIADGRSSEIVYTAPWIIDGDTQLEYPLEGCSSSVLTELLYPGSLVPAGIKFHIKAASND